MKTRTRCLLALLLLAANTLWGSPQGPHMAVTAAADGSMVLNWESWPASQGYRVEFQDRLGSGWLPCPWQDQWPISATSWVDSRPLVAGRFYRVMSLTASRGAIAAAVPMTNYTTAQLSQLFLASGFPIAPQYAVDVYYLLYNTLTADGAGTRASGVVVLPRAGTRALPLLSHQHGTVVLTNDVASQGTGEYVLGLMWAATGYAAALPDYLGMGSGSGLHPYVHARSEATAAVDLLRAARVLCAQRSVPLNGQLFLIGYSQGGQATMATHREIEQAHTNEFVITASAPMAGPHDMSGTMADLLTTNQPYGSPYYLAYTLFSYNSVYRLYESTAQVLAEPYATTLPPLFDGRHSDGQINAAMPAIPNQILRPEYLESFRSDPNHPFRQALRRNDLYNWRPLAPMRLYHCAGDRTVPQLNSIIAVNAFHANGASQVQFIDPYPAGDHGSGAPYAFIAAKQWFDSLKQ